MNRRDLVHRFFYHDRSEFIQNSMRDNLMIVGFHLIWTAYGWWLPNDPRGSMSEQVLTPEIAELGEHHFGRKRVQPRREEVREFYGRAENVLKHELLTFNQTDVQTIARDFAEVIHERRYTCYACAIMPDHVHLLIRKHRDRAETMLDQLQAASQRSLISAKRRVETHPVWGGPGWKVFLNTREDVGRTVRYVEQNPVKLGRPRQHWDFVKAYDGWLPGRHSDTCGDVKR